MSKLVKRSNKKGFTLVELIVVIAIIAILALIMIPTISGYISSANEKSDQASARNLYTAAVLVASQYDGEGFPTDWTGVKNYGNFGEGWSVNTESGNIVVTLNGMTFDGSAFGTAE